MAAEDIQKLLEAAMAAPSGRNVRPWEFVVVTEPAVCERLSHATRPPCWSRGRRCVIVVCGREVDSHHWIVDGAAAAENILLEAVSLGLGGVWVGVFPVPEREAHVRQVIGLPEGVRPLCMVPVGHPAESPEPRTQYDAAHVHYNRY